MSDRQQQIEAYYPLSPLQQGLLFRWLSAPGSTAYFQQVTCALAGPMDEAAFERAWQRLVERHAILRTAFAWEGAGEPLQVVGRKVRLPVRWEDWRDCPPQELKACFRAFCRADREQGFQISRAPLMRLAMLRVGDEETWVVWSFHHLLVDGWSTSLLLREAFTLYDAFARGEEPVLPEARPYREYIAWLRQQSLAEAEAYWRRRLEGIEAPVPLPVERDRPGDGGFADPRIRLPAARTRELHSAARRHRLTLNSIIQGAWALLLARYARRSEAVFGVTLAGRPGALPGASSMIGVFTNVLPARVPVPDALPVADWLGRVQMDQAELSQYEHTPLAQVQTWCGLPHLFNALLIFENYPLVSAIRLVRSLAVRDVQYYEYTQYPLALVAMPDVELMLQVKYDRGRFDDVTVRRMLEHLEALLAGLTAIEPGMRVGDLSLLTPAERHQVTAEWNDEPAGFFPDRCLHQLFEEQAALTPDRIALAFPGLFLTYGELDRRADWLARRLRGCGVGPEVRVGLCLERSPEMLVALLGTLKAGGAYVPLDPDHPRERLEAILAEAAPAVLLVQPHLRGLLPETGPPVLVLAAGMDDTPGTRACGGEPDDLAYVLFTSGSTGRPKGVAVSHRAIANRVLWMRELLRPTPDDRVAYKTPFSFDASIWEIFLPLSAGSQVVIAEPEGHRDPAYLVELIQREEVTILQLVPSMLQVLLDQPKLRQVRSLRRLFCGGESLPPQLQERVFAVLETVDLHNLYGPTEAAIDATHWPCPRDGVRDAVVIGRPIANDQVYLVGTGFQPVPAGVPGELLIGGVGLARGYLGQPALTAEKFVPDPFAGEPGRRLYRTGDLARCLSDGVIEFLGRVDLQVKIRGVRIELAEIESALLQHPGVREVVAAVLEGPAADKRLVAYVVMTVGQELDEAGLRDFAGRKVPAVMVPSRIVQLPAMPLLPNGKVDRQALPAPDETVPPGYGAVPLYTPVQEMVAAVWSEILGRRVTSARDDFFELGGHSLLATQVVARLCEALRVDVKIRSIFERPVLEELAGELEELLRSAMAAPSPPLRPAERNGPLPLSYAQQRLWVLEQLQPGAAAYHLPVAVRFSGALDVAALERSLAEVIRRHEVLRTRFIPEAGRPRQVVLPALPPQLLRADLSALPATAGEELLSQLLQALARQSFDLSRGPLLRTALLALRAEEHVLSLTFHHIVADGWSVGLFLGELSSLYRALSQGRRSPLPALPLQYADFAVWERSWLEGEALEARLRFWLLALEGAPPRTELPTDFPRPDQVRLRGAACSRELSEELVVRLRELSRRSSVTLFMVVLAGFEAVLHRWTGQDDLVVGTVIANRTRAELEPLIGCFINFLPLRLRIQGDESGAQLLVRVRDSVLEAYSHQDCPFDRLVQAKNPDRTASNPLYNVGFLLQNQTRFTAVAAGLTASYLPVDLGSSLLDLRLVAWESGDGLQMTLEYRSDLLTATTAGLLLEALQHALEQLAETPEREVALLPLPVELEQQAMSARLRDRRPRIAVASTFTAQPLERPLRFWMQELEIDAEIAFAPYGQVFQELLDGKSLLASNPDGMNLILVRLEDWLRGLELSDDEADRALRRNIFDLATALREAAVRSMVPLLVCVCQPSTRALAKPGAEKRFQQAEALLAAELGGASGVYLVTPGDLQAVYPVTAYDDPYSDELGHVPYTPAFFTALATMVARRFFVLRTPPYKVIAVDCDGTLWNGICGEDGPHGVGIDAPRQGLQELLVRQHDAGMLICLCSKNNEDDVLAVFDARADMPLRREHIVEWKINWQPKSQNLAALADKLQLGLDSFIFMDDSPIECAEVEAACPEVLVVSLPTDAAEIPILLRNIWAFDRLHVTSEDRVRTQMYRQNEERTRLQASSSSFSEFMHSLELQVDVSPLQAHQVHRVAQLTQRTNQFNLTTIRCSESEIEAVCNAADRECLVIEVRDRFGNYGLVGAAVFGTSSSTLEVENLLLSCRVLGRGVEHRVLEELGRIAAARGLQRVDLTFVTTVRNRPARDFLESFGEEWRVPSKDGFVYRLPVELLDDLGRRLLTQESSAGATIC